MNDELYQQFLRLKDTGKKPEAKTALSAFIASFEPAEIPAWVKTFLERGDYGHRIRHEIYEHLVFPVLLDGYRRGDHWSTVWLAKPLRTCP